jgi:hypothetical protein
MFGKPDVGRMGIRGDRPWVSLLHIGPFFPGGESPTSKSTTFALT